MTNQVATLINTINDNSTNSSTEYHVKKFRKLPKEMIDDIVNDLIEVSFTEGNSFSRVKEILTRIGISSFDKETKKPVLFQSVHILKKKDKYYLIHFKQLFALDGRRSTMSEDDYIRRDTIASLLEQWGIVNLLTKDSLDLENTSMKNIKVIPYKEKENWILKPKYRIGNKQNSDQNNNDNNN